MMKFIDLETRVMFIMIFLSGMRVNRASGARVMNQSYPLAGMMQIETTGALLGCLNAVSVPFSLSPLLDLLGIMSIVLLFKPYPKNPAHVKPRIPYSYLPRNIYFAGYHIL